MNKVIRKLRPSLVFLCDMNMVIFAWVAAFLITSNLKELPGTLTTLFPFVLIVQGSGFYLCGLYRGVWRFASIPDLIRILKAVIFGTLGLSCLMLILGAQPFSRPAITIIYGMFLVLFLSSPRVIFRWLKDYQRFFKSSQRILIVGAGSAGESLVRDLMRFASQGLEPIAFVDDNRALHGKEIHGIRVKGSCQDIPKLVNSLQIQMIIIAMPSGSAANMRRIVDYCNQTTVPFRTLPGIKELTEGRVTVNELRDVSLEDLLGREEVDLAWDKIKAVVNNKVIVVTGGGGSIGSELCIQLANLLPKQLIIIESCEYNLYLSESELTKNYPDLDIVCVLSSVTDRKSMEDVFGRYQPDLVFHAAAYKHVPLLESQIRTAIDNNINGTRVIAETASAHGCRTFVLISTDKAVNPTNVMGATKRASEIFCQNFNFNANTRFITVRFGNVLDSAGSVVPLFRKQLQEGGPLTVTHPEMTRFFMTIPEACQLILQAASIGQGGEIFVLDMGEPIKIKYLAEQLIRLSGKILRDEIDIKYIGLRPGEKLHEELFYTEEELSSTIHPKIRKAKAQRRHWLSLVDLFNELKMAGDDYNEKKLIALLHQIVPEYQTQNQSGYGHLQQSDGLRLVYNQ